MHPRKPPGGRSTDPNDYPAGKIDLRASQRRRAQDEGARARRARRPVTPSACSAGRCRGRRCARRTRSSRSATSTATARRGRLSKRARVRLSSTCAASAHAQARRRPLDDAARTTTSCSFDCRRALALRATATTTSARRKEGAMSTHDLIPSSSPRSSGCASVAWPTRCPIASCSPQQDMTFEELLALVLTDEIARRDTTAVSNRVATAKLDPGHAHRALGQERQGHLRQTLFTELCSLRFLRGAQARRHPRARRRRQDLHRQRARSHRVSSPLPRALHARRRDAARLCDRAASTTRATPR